MKRGWYLMAGFAVLAVGAVVGAAVWTPKPYETLRLGHYTFHIPKQNAMTDAVPLWLRWMPGLDDGSRSALFRIDEQEIRENVPGYMSTGVRFRDDIEVLISALTAEEVQRFHDPQSFAQFGDLWRSEGSYKNRKVESFGNAGYKVYRAVEYPYSWALLTRIPDGSKPLPDDPMDVWVAHCLEQKPSDGVIANCTSYALLGDIALEFDISGYNLPIIDAVRTFLKTRVLEWKQPGG